MLEKIIQLFCKLLAVALIFKLRYDLFFMEMFLIPD